MTRRRPRISRLAALIVLLATASAFSHNGEEPPGPPPPIIEKEITPLLGGDVPDRIFAAQAVSLLYDPDHTLGLPSRTRLIIADTNYQVRDDQMMNNIFHVNEFLRRIIYFQLSAHWR